MKSKNTITEPQLFVDDHHVTYMNLADKYSTSTLTNKIRLKGRHEQEIQFLFSGLYGNKAVTKNTKGYFKQSYRSNHLYINRI